MEEDCVQWNCEEFRPGGELYPMKLWEIQAFVRIFWRWTVSSEIVGNSGFCGDFLEVNCISTEIVRNLDLCEDF